MRISDWSSDVCSSDLAAVELRLRIIPLRAIKVGSNLCVTVTRAVMLVSIIRRHSPSSLSWAGPVPRARPELLSNMSIAANGAGRDRKSVVEGKGGSGRGDTGVGRSFKKRKKKH